MRKTLTFSSIAIAGLVVVYFFLTAKTYPQLAIASLLYLPIAFLAYKAFQGPSSKLSTPEVSEPQPVNLPPQLPQIQPSAMQSVNNSENVTVTDIEKRTFLKLLGSIGLSFFVFSILGRRVDNLFFNKSDTALPVNVPTLSPTDGFTISEIDDSLIGYYGFTHKTKGWFIMKQDPDTGSFRYAKGDNNFASNWSSRENLKYDYYHNVF